MAAADPGRQFKRRDAGCEEDFGVAKEPELLTHRITAKKKNNERKFETDQGCFGI